MVTLSLTRTKQSELTGYVPTSRWISKFRLLVIALNFGAITVSLAAAFYFEFGDVPATPVTGSGFSYGHAAITITLIRLFALGLSEAWSHRTLGKAIPETRAVMTATLVAFEVVAIFSYLT